MQTMKLSNTLLLSLLFTSSCLIFKPVKLLIDQKDTHYWSGKVEGKEYRLFITKEDRLWFDGHLTVENDDTLYLNGFQKGNNHPTKVRNALTDSTKEAFLGHLFIWAKGWEADTIEIINRSDSISSIPVNFSLYKKLKLAPEGAD